MASVVQGITHLVQGLFEAALGLVRGIFSAALAIVNTIFSTIFGLLVSPASSHLAPLSAAADLSNSTASTTSSPA
jgi:phage-related protein